MKPILMCDLDDVITKGCFLKLLNRLFQTNYAEEDICTYHVEDILEAPEDRVKFMNYVMDVNFYSHTELMEDAKEVLERLNQKYELYICTMALLSCGVKRIGELLMYKNEFLLKELPFIKEEQHIYIANKSLVKANIRIDDKLENLEGDGEIKLLYSAYHNREYTDVFLKEKGVRRVSSWKEIEKILLS